MRSLIITLISLLNASVGWAMDSIYCAQNHGYIHLGMTEDEVISACGQPLSKQNSNNPVMQKIPMQQLFYQNEGGATAFYGVWKLPIGNSNYDDAPFQGTSGGVQLQVNVVNNAVRSIILNGSSSNALSICGGNIQIGDPVNKVYGACGSPATVNNTFIEQPIPNQGRPQIWTYQANQYSNPFSLTFVNGQLQSID